MAIISAIDDTAILRPVVIDRSQNEITPHISIDKVSELESSKKQHKIDDQFLFARTTRWTSNQKLFEINPKMLPSYCFV